MKKLFLKFKKIINNLKYYIRINIYCCKHRYDTTPWSINNNQLDID